MSGAELESSLLDRAVAGDRAALSQLLLVHFDDLHQHVESRISPRLQGLMRADDILQQTFLRAAQAIGTFEPRHGGAFRGWLRTISDNLVRDAEKRRRRERRFPVFLRPVGAGDAEGSAPQAMDQLPGSMTSPSGRVQRHEAVRCLQAALAELPEDQREVLRRRYLLGQSLDEIANATARTRGAVRGLCFRGRQNLRTVMGQSSLYFSR
ncbi:MAG: sigma-70 family RNA polymerase sigma factor [Pirellulaceae bacterium]